MLRSLRPLLRWPRLRQVPSTGMRTLIGKQLDLLFLADTCGHGFCFLPGAIQVFKEQGTVRAKHAKPGLTYGLQMPVPADAAGLRHKVVAEFLFDPLSINPGSSLAVVLFEVLIAGAFAGGAFHVVRGKEVMPRITRMNTNYFHLKSLKNLR